MDDENPPINAPTPHVIGIEFYSKKGNKDELLINANDLEASIDAKSRWFTYSFVHPVFLTNIEIFSQGYESYDKFEIVVEHVDGTFHEEKLGVNKGASTLRLAKLCNSFRFRPDKRYLSEPKLLRVSATGYTEEEFHEFEWAIREYDTKAADLHKREQKFQEQADSIAELRAQQIELDSIVGKSKAELEQLTKSLNSTKAQIGQHDSTAKDLRQKVADAESELRTVSSSVEKESAKLKELVRELRLFPSEIAGFVKEGNRSITSYSLIGLPFLVILAIIVIKLFSNAVDLTQIFKVEESVDIWAIFLTRLPFVLIAVALVEACGFIVGRLVFEVIRINRQRLEFAKLSIIAKDVSTASAIGLADLSDKEVFELETKLKMELLREHMKNYVGNEFEYKGTGLVAAIKGVAERLSSKNG